MMKLNRMNQNIEALLKLNDKYEKKKEQIKFKPVKISHMCLFGTVGSLVAMASVHSSFLSGTMFAGLGGYTIGCTIPYIVKKIKVVDLDYQIYMNDKIINDLENEKVKISRR